MSKKIVLVTGANKGIGFGIAKHLGLSGWQVIIGARDVMNIVLQKPLAN